MTRPDGSSSSSFRSEDLFRELRELRRAGDHVTSHRRLQDVLRRDALNAESVETAGRFLGKELAAGRLQPEARVLILGQCTTSWLVPVLTAESFGKRFLLEVSDGNYDNVLQDLHGCAQDSAPNVVILLPWAHRLLGADPDQLDALVEEELTLWRPAWERVRVLGARLIQVGYDLPRTTGIPVARKTYLDAIRVLNERLGSQLPDDAYFVQLSEVAGALGRERFYSARRYHWTKQPFSESGTVRLARHLLAGCRALLRGPKKVLALDLDNTLWGGVVGETGPLGIDLGEGPAGEAFVAFQQYVKSLTQQGCLLTVVSKNNLADAIEPFEQNPHMVLQRQDFAAFEANWEPKALSLRRMAKTLRLGLDSFVFFDDNPAEREHVRQALPDVAVVDVPPEPAEYVAALASGLWFETVRVTDEDRQRGKQYQAERERRDTESEAGSLEEYLSSLRMHAEVRELNNEDLPRSVQLIGKTNQFNLTTRRHSPEVIEKMLQEPGTLALTMRVQDKFGDLGLVSVLLAVKAEDAPATLDIDTWLMSCRVIGRTAEQAFFNELRRRARASGYRTLRGCYIPTAKNAPVAGLLPELGFEHVRDEGRVRYYQLELAAARDLTTHVELARVATP